MAFPQTFLLDTAASVNDNFSLLDRDGNAQTFDLTPANGEWSFDANTTGSTSTGPTGKVSGTDGYIYTETSGGNTPSLWEFRRNVLDSRGLNVFVDLKICRGFNTISDINIEYSTLQTPGSWTTLQTIAGLGGEQGWTDYTFDFSGIETQWLTIRITCDYNDDFHNDMALSTWTEYATASSGISSVTPSEFDLDETNIDLDGSVFEATQATGKVYISDKETLAGGANEVDVSDAVVTWSDVLVNLDLTLLSQATLDLLDTLGPGARNFILVNDSGDESFKGIIYHRAAAFSLSASTHVAASGENTTARLIAPSGKTTANFGGGRIQDDENPTDTVDLALDEYREDHPIFKVLSTAVADKTYEFRVLWNGIAVDTISVTPQITINSGGSITLTILNSTHKHTSEGVVLTQKHNVVIQDSTHKQTSEGLTLIQKHILNVLSSKHGHTSDVVSLIQGHVLTILSSSHKQTSEIVSLVQKHNLIIQDSAHKHRSSTIGLTQKHILGIQNSVHKHVSESISITQKHVLNILNSTHPHVSDNLSLTQKHVLVIKDSVHKHTSDTVLLSLGIVLNILSSTHGHTSDSVNLTQKHILNVLSSKHKHVSDVLSLVQKHLLAIKDSRHIQTSDIVNLLQRHLLTIESSTHKQTSNSLSLTQKHILNILDSTHKHTSEVVVLTADGGAIVITRTGAKMIVRFIEPPTYKLAFVKPNQFLVSHVPPKQYLVNEKK